MTATYTRCMPDYAAGMSIEAVDELLADAPSIMNLQQVAALLDLDTKTVRRLILSGALPALRITRKWRIARADVRTFMLTPSRINDDDQGEAD